ncbi:TPR domain protein [Penicillium brasilianum]|uniref:TPR domain protein n=1 Tax=Penicillium brasilianum TaxID=104259 RepID=A0A1S9RKH3_PENBI|nr:TPR domain protein [Penicillium brasilianum]
MASVSISFGEGNRGTQVGINNGSIHLPPVRPETPPAPLSNVPFRRDPDFVSRDTLLDEIHEKISVTGSRIALVGIGGVGIEYSYRARSESKATWVFWVHASNAVRFEQSFRDIAERAKIAGRQDPTVNIFQLVESWLQDGKREKWLLILDNIDDDEFLRQPQSLKFGQTNASTKPLLGYLPQSPNGSILITSRSREVALRLVDHQDIIKVEPMKKPEAVELLQRKVGLTAENPEMLLLAEELEFMPLAIIQAAGYIVHQGPRCSVSQYLELFRKSDRGATRLLDYEAGHLYRDWEAINSILVTWQISFDHIRRTRPLAADLLSLMSFFDRQGVSDDLLRDQYKIKPDDSNSEKIELEHSEDDTDSTSGSETDYDFEDHITTLRDFSFISINKDNVFTMHRLVQLTVRVWLKTEKQLERWKEQFITTLWQRFPTVTYENWAQCQPLFPHVKSAISQRPKSQDSLGKWATLLYKGAWYAQESGNIAESVDMAYKSRKEMASLFGSEDEQTLDGSVILASAYRLQGAWKKAEQLELQVIDTRKAKLGVNHPDTLASIANLASTYRSQGRWKEAEQLDVQVMDTRKATLGVDHPDTILSMANLASTFWNQGRWAEAEQLEVQVLELETSKMKLSASHPNTLASIANLASTYRKQGRLVEAEQLEVQVRDTCRTKLSVDNPYTLTSTANLASTYRSQGRWKEAEQLEVQVMKTRKAKLGVDHPDTILSMANLASTLWNQGRLAEAEELEVQVMGMSKIKLGVNHPDILTIMANLASTYRDQGRLKDAEQLDMQVMEISKKKLGEDHPDTLTSLANLATTFWNQGRFNEAEQLDMQVIETSKMKLGADHPLTLTSMGNLASIFSYQGRSEEAEQLQMQVMAARKMKLGADHPLTLTSMGNLASTFFDRGRWKEAEQLFVQVFETSKMKLGVDHPDTLTSMANLAYILHQTGQLRAALLLMAECVSLSDRRLGPDHPDTVHSKSALAEWRAMDESPSFELKAPTETNDDQILASPRETSEPISE